MRPIGMHNYFVYITTSNNKSVLYIGVTNNLPHRLWQHEEESKTSRKSFAGRYNCVNLIYYECFGNITDAINREKEIKGWTRKKKETLINTFNPEWRFLNDELEP